jgi:hypothetical protein
MKPIDCKENSNRYKLLPSHNSSKPRLRRWVYADEPVVYADEPVAVVGVEMGKFEFPISSPWN